MESLGGDGAHKVTGNANWVASLAPTCMRVCRRVTEAYEALILGGGVFTFCTDVLGGMGSGTEPRFFRYAAQCARVRPACNVTTRA